MKTPDLDLDLLRCFLTVAESGGFTAASRVLHLSQSAVSLKIQRLESQMNCSVFVRTSRSLELTEEGETLLGYARRLLTLNREMLNAVARPASGGTLRVGVMQQFGQALLPDLLAEFKHGHPGIRLSVEIGMSAELLRGLEEDRYDLVVAAASHRAGAPSKTDALIQESVLVREPCVWVQAETSLIDLHSDPLPLVLFPSPCGFRKMTLDLLEKEGRGWYVAYSSSSLESIQTAVKTDLGISLVAKSSVLPGMKTIRPGGVLPALPDTDIAIYLRKTPAETLARSFAVSIAKAVSRKRKSGKQLQPIS